MSTNNYHTSVLSSAVVKLLKVKEGKKYIDATLGGAGHAGLILQKGALVLGIDQDEDAISYSSKKHEYYIKNKSFNVVKGNFLNLAQIARLNKFENVDGILFDLGVSSHQLDTKDRGFAFKSEGPLDMRMNKSLAVSAKDLINGLNKKELIMLFTKYGQEPKAKAVAARIVEARKNQIISTTTELASIVGSVIKRSEKGIHPATRVFQALRIAINDELFSLEEALPQALQVVKKEGRIVVISYHSLEDRIVKKSFMEFENEKKGIIITKKPISPENLELLENKRSRSAKLRAFEKI